MPSQSITIAELIRSGLALTWQEAIALARGVAAASSGCVPRVETTSSILEHFALCENGSVQAASAECIAVSVASLAMFLGRLLPAEPADPALRPPPGVHVAIGRALGLVPSAPFASLGHFSEALGRFEQEERRTVLRAVFGRYLGSSDARAEGALWPADERRVTSPRTDTLRRLLRDADEEAWRSGRHARANQWTARRQGPDADTLRRFLREADRRNYELSRRLAVRGVDGRAVAARGFARIARKALPLHRTPRLRGSWSGNRVAAGLGILLIAAGAAAERQPIGDAWSFLIASLNSPASSSPPATVATTGSISSGLSGGDRDAVRPTDTAAPPARSTLNARTVTLVASVQSDTRSPDDAESEDDSASLDALSALPGAGGRMVEALDVAQRPVFSPSFAADRAVVFDNEAQPAAGAATHSFVRVLSIADDRGRNYHPRLSPDGSTIAFDSDRDGVRGVYVASRDGRHVRRVSGAEQYAAFPAWSPDGNHLAFVQSEPGQPTVWNVWSADLRSDALARLTWFREGQPWGVSWFPDGNRLCFAHENMLVVMDTTTGSARTFATPRPAKFVRLPAVSPDGSRVLFQIDDDGAWLLEMSDGSMRQILADPSVDECAWSRDGKEIVFRTRDAGEWTSWSLAPEGDK